MGSTKMNRLRQSPLFDTNLPDHLVNQRRELASEVEHMSPAKILGVGEEELCEYLVTKYALGEVPRIIDSRITADEPTQVHYGAPHYTTGVSVTIRVPFDGLGGLFRYRPSTFRGDDVNAEIGEQELLLRYSEIVPNPEALKERYTRELEVITENLEWLRKDIESFNASLERIAEEAVTAKKEKVRRNQEAIQEAVTALGIPIQRRTDAPKTSAIPEIRRKPKIELPKVKKGSPEPEPVLPTEEYEHILSVIQNMVLVMERSPKAFIKMEEEDLRQHFLVQLNGQYEGQATGETFNYDGKTDILIRHKGRNVFIAECMFWEGEKSLTAKISQLLGYTSWRDTKTAVLLFSRRNSFSTVLAKVPGAVESHACYERSLDVTEETVFRYEFHQRDDCTRKLILTVMAFNVPR